MRTGEAPVRQVPRFVELMLEHGIAVLTISGLLIYGWVRLGIDAFYSRLGVTPEEVGLTYAAILSRAALGLIAVVAAIVIAATEAIVFVWLGYLFGSELSEPAANKRPTRLQAGQIVSPWILVTVLSIPSGILLLTGFVPSFGLTTRTTRLVFLGESVYIPFATAIGFLYGKRASAPAQFGKAGKQNWPTPLIIGVLIFVLLTAGLVVSEWAGDRAASRVSSGETLTRGRIFALPWILNLEAKCITLIRLSDGRPLPQEVAPVRLLYLGKADGTLVLYEADSGPLRLPADGLIVKGVASNACRN